MLAPALLLAACEARKEEPLPPGPSFEPASFESLPGWRSDSLSAALPALRRSCGRLASLPAERPVGPAGLAGTVADWQEPCRRLAALPDGNDPALRELLERDFQPFAVLDGGKAEGLFTGYYEAELNGSLRPGARYDTPLYGPPADMVTVDLRDFRADLPAERLVGRVAEGRLQPYPERAVLENGHLAGRGAEILWVDDPVDAFFLHVQGSGVVQLDDGRRVRVGFAGSNGRPFYAIGRALIDEGIIERERSSMQFIRDWLRANPDQAQALMHRNERFIFFRLIEGEGPIGAQGVPLTEGRSLAVDPDHLPLGAPLWLDTTSPTDQRPLQRLMVAQDTGSAIKGVVRGDFFWGSGEPALEQAGRMRQQGRYWLLLPRAVAERRAAQS